MNVKLSQQSACKLLLVSFFQVVQWFQSDRHRLFRHRFATSPHAHSSDNAKSVIADHIPHKGYSLKNSSACYFKQFPSLALSPLTESCARTRLRSIASALHTSNTSKNTMGNRYTKILCSMSTHRVFRTLISNNVIRFKIDRRPAVNNIPFSFRLMPIFGTFLVGESLTGQLQFHTKSSCTPASFQ